MTDISINPYEGGHVYILDSCPSAEEASEFAERSAHDQKNKIIERLFRKHFEYEIHNVTFPERSKPGVVLDYFETELRKMEEKELIIIYFHGGGGGNGEDYTWRFSHSPKREFGAYEIIQAIIDSGVDCLLLLDCYIPDRFHHKWKPGPGNVEIIATGQPLQSSDGKACAHDPGNFTTCLVNMTDNFVKHIQTDYKGHHAPKSIPGLLAMKPMRNRMSANPRRIWINKTRKTKQGNMRIVERFVILPDNIRETGKAGLFAKCIQGPSMPGLLENHGGRTAGEGVLHEDEGVGDMVEEERDEKDPIFVSPDPEVDGGD
ncbi:hypothetical protein LTR08_008112 [Meristemomyces frigidus]|nr:hypothetical protein LTR08_008112 [Meristemomyces frigidus]